MAPLFHGYAALNYTVNLHQPTCRYGYMLIYSLLTVLEYAMRFRVLQYDIKIVY